jgi:dihydroorotate dehydrogenase (fumarate)
VSDLLATSYLGLPLSGPIIASAGPFTGRLDTLRELEAAGAAAVVLPSLFEEDVVAEEMEFHEFMEVGSDFAEYAGGMLQEVELPDLGSDRHVRLVAEAKAALSVPVIASVNAAHAGSWERYATMMVEAGADAVELNVYAVSADPRRSAADVEAAYLDIIREVKAAISVPLTVKLSPFFSSFSHFAAAAVEAGADGLVLFNRFYAPDIDLGTLGVVPTVELSTPAELRLPLRWMGILRSQLPTTSLAATSGVHSAADVIKVLLAGASVACTTSAVLHHGPGHVGAMLEGLRFWLEENDYTGGVDQMRGSVSASSVADPSAYERSQYLDVIKTMRSRY